MTDPSEQARPPAVVPQRPSGARETSKAPPQRPPLQNPNTAPVLTRLTPPFSIRTAQFFWILSFAIGGFAVVYFFVIRKDQVPLISDAVRAVDPGRADETYTAAADIIYWSVFGLLVAVLLVQITLLVSFMARRPKIRWWQLLTWALQVVTLGLSLELVLTGEPAQPLRTVLAAQCALVLLGLISSVMPKAIAWSARQHDVVRHQRDDAARSL